MMGFYRARSSPPRVCGSPPSGCRACTLIPVPMLLLAAVLLGVVNAIVRPIAFILTLPVTILSLGLFLFVLNALMVWLVAWMVPGFHVRGFKAALLTAIIVWIVGWIGSWFIGKKGFEKFARR